MKAIIFGAPGAGKGTYSARLKSDLGVETIAIGDILRESVKQNSELGKKVKTFVESGALVPDAVVVEVLKDRLQKVPNGQGFLLDGFPRTIEQAKILDGIVRPDFIILLEVPDEVIIERLSTRRVCKSCGSIYNVRFLKPKIEDKCDKCVGELFQRNDDNPEVIKDRLRLYKNQTEPLIAYYKAKKIPFVVSITKTADSPLEPRIAEVLENIKKLKIK